MDRLTTKSILGGWTALVPKQEVVDRLAAYEDTGLEPGEIANELNNAYDIGYQACLNYKAKMPWCAAEELQSYRAVGTVEEFRAALRRIAEYDKARPYSIGTKVFWLPSDGALKDHIIEIVVHGYSESAWQGSKNIGKDHRFIICHNSYNEPHAYPLNECYATRQEAEAALENQHKKEK